MTITVGDMMVRGVTLRDISAHLPRALTSLGAAVGAALALTPPSLPRVPLVEFAVLACLVVAGALFGAVASGVIRVVGRCVGHRSPAKTCPVTGSARVVAAAVCLSASIAMSAWNMLWENTLRDELGIGGLSWVWGVLFCTPVVAGYAAVATVRGRRRHRAALTPQRAATPTVAVTCTTAVIATLIAGTVSCGSATGLSSGATSSARSAASPASGRSHAESFLTDGATPASLRVYEPLDQRTLRDRARDAVKAWLALGGAHRSTVVIAVPTGSGWVDPAAIAAFESRSRTDLSVIAVQYDSAPSWESFLVHRTLAISSATAVTAAVLHALTAMPRGERPHVVLYGQSLGAVGADAARASDGGSRVCTTLLAGPPADSIAADGLHRQVLVNRSDPVADWSPALVWRPTRPTHQRVDTGTALRSPPWIPVASFISRSIDLLSARSFGSGVGHRYGPEQAQIREQCLDHTALRRDPR